jgi:hypothetical protein
MMNDPWFGLALFKDNAKRIGIERGVRDCWVWAFASADGELRDDVVVNRSGMLECAFKIGANLESSAVALKTKVDSKI